MPITPFMGVRIFVAHAGQEFAFGARSRLRHPGGPASRRAINSICKVVSRVAPTRRAGCSIHHLHRGVGCATSGWTRREA